MVDLRGPLGALIMLVLVVASFGLLALSAYLVGSGRGRRVPRWALGLMIASLAGNWLTSLLQVVWVRALLAPLEPAALVLVAVELWHRYRLRRRSEQQST